MDTTHLERVWREIDELDGEVEDIGQRLAQVESISHRLLIALVVALVAVGTLYAHELRRAPKAVGTTAALTCIADHDGRL